MLKEKNVLMFCTTFQLMSINGIHLIINLAIFPEVAIMTSLVQSQTNSSKRKYRRSMNGSTR